MSPRKDMKAYSAGGEAMAQGGEADSKDSDHELMMDHVAMEAMHAIETKDKAAFRDAFHVLVANTLSQMGMSEEGEE